MKNSKARWSRGWKAEDLAGQWEPRRSRHWEWGWGKLGSQIFGSAERIHNELHLLQTLEKQTHKKNLLHKVRWDKIGLNHSSTSEMPGGIYPHSRHHFEEEIVVDHLKEKVFEREFKL